MKFLPYLILVSVVFLWYSCNCAPIEEDDSSTIEEASTSPVEEQRKLKLRSDEPAATSDELPLEKQDLDLLLMSPSNKGRRTQRQLLSTVAYPLWSAIRPHLIRLIGTAIGKHIRNQFGGAEDRMAVGSAKPRMSSYYRYGRAGSGSC
ncbi:uncharacterized protein LOC134287452 [Aedes albopictus]|uniref:Uncharacterized protein n=1 Tax=Aedes albopictus TaxID=7160 RepID=A0ABM1YKX2_AEDAL